MSILRVSLVGSLVINAALAVGLAVRNSRMQPSRVPAGPSAAIDSRALPEHPPADLGTDFAALTPEQLRTRLQSLNLPKNIVDHLVGARIYARLRARQHELALEAIKAAPAWRLPALRNRFALLSSAQRKELRDLESDARNETLRVLGSGYLDRDGAIASKYSFVPPDKAVLLDALERDYENLTSELRDDTRNLRIPADRDREKLLRTEQDLDLAALLSPAELDAYELRGSPTAQNPNFQFQMLAFQPTEAEYRAVFAIQKAEDANRSAGIAPSRSAHAEITGAKTVMFSGNTLAENEVRSALGEARFADWQLTSQPPYQALIRLTSGTDITRETIKQVSVLVNETSEASWRIAEDKNLTGPQKKAALADLAATARTQINTQLPGPVAESFLKTGRWFDALNNGTAVKFGPAAIGFRPVDSPPPAAVSPRPGP